MSKMDQASPKPITLTILPQPRVPASVAINETPSVLQQNKTNPAIQLTNGSQNIAPPIQITVNQNNGYVAPVPNFQYTPIIPQISSNTPQKILNPTNIIPKPDFIVTGQTENVEQNIVPPPAFTIGRPNAVNVDNDYIERQKYLNRERQKRFKEKTQKFVDLAKIDNIHERIRQLWLITYPDADRSMDPKMFDILISQFVNSSCALMTNQHR